MNIFDQMKQFGHEKVVFVYDKHTDLKAITCIHDSTLGASFGGTRLWNYATEQDALTDVLRLARGMTFKNSVAGLDAGGCKNVIIGDPAKIKSEALFRTYGRHIQSMNGQVLTGQDINITEKDISYMQLESDYLVGRADGLGMPGATTAIGVFYGVKASVYETFKTNDLSNLSFAIQGVGACGGGLAKHLTDAGVKKIFFTDVNQASIERFQKQFPHAQYVSADKYFSLDVDVLCPCAMGAILNPKTIPTIKAKVVAGSANNQLEDETRDGNALKDRGILYAPDFVINGAGVMHVYYEYQNQTMTKVLAETEKIYERLLMIFAISKNENVNTQVAALKYAQRRIDLVADIHKSYIGKQPK